MERRLPGSWPGREVANPGMTKQEIVDSTSGLRWLVIVELRLGLFDVQCYGHHIGTLNIEGAAAFAKGVTEGKRRLEVLIPETVDA